MCQKLVMLHLLELFEATCGSPNCENHPLSNPICGRCHNSIFECKCRPCEICDSMFCPYHFDADPEFPEPEDTTWCEECLTREDLHAKGFRLWGTPCEKKNVRNHTKLNVVFTDVKIKVALS